MNASAPHVTVHARGHALADPPGREYQQLWFSIAQRNWTSIVLVPVDPAGSAAAVAISLADVANRLINTPVTAITAGKLDFNSAYVLADLQRHASADRSRGLLVDVTDTMTSVPTASAGKPEPRANGGDHPTPTPMRPPVEALPTSGKLIVSIPPVVVEPLGVAVAQAGGTVVLCIEMTRTRVADARKTIELIGRDLIGGCFVFRGGIGNPHPAT